MHNHILDKFFQPESIAIVGASSKENSIGRIIIENLHKDGFPGGIYPINPKHGEILGIPAFPSIAAAPAGIDLAIVAVPIQGVPEVMRECGQAKVPGVIIISAGGKEVGEEGKKIEAEIHAAAKAGGIRYLGPNCMGILSPLPSQRQFCGAFGATRKCGPSLPERGHLQRHPGHGRGSAYWLQPFRQHRFHGGPRFCRNDRLPGQR